LGVIEARDLSKVYPNGTAALTGLDLTVNAGEMLFIRGPSGAGKTTLLRLLMGVEQPSSGSLRLGGLDMKGADAHTLRNLRRKMGVVFQDFRLIKGRTARENVEMGLRVLGVTGRQMRQRSGEYLEFLGMASKAGTYVDLLSWGEQQRVVIARALAREPEIVLADEPTGNLDDASSDRVLTLLMAARDRGATVLVATHASRMLERPGHRVIALAEGRVVQDPAGHFEGGMAR
jgi:cell division transport system ATP-binding protein